MSIRAIYERNLAFRKAAAALRRQNKPKISSLNKYKPQESSFFTKLPQEIRHMIYREVFAMLSQLDNGKLLVHTVTKRKGRREIQQTKISAKQDGPPLGVPSLFLVCKQMRQESKPIFWGSMTFSFGASSYLVNFCLEKQLPHHRRKENIPALFPLDLVRNIEVWIARNLVAPAVILERFWVFARFLPDTVKLKVRMYNLKSKGEPVCKIKNGPALAIYHQVREYQTWREERGVSLDLIGCEIFQWVTNKAEFKVCFPGFSDKAENEEAEEGSKGKTVLD